MQGVFSAFWQVPVALHALHAPQLAAEQHTLSVQNKPGPHWSVVAHVAPGAFLPHKLPTHVLGETQSLFDAQVSLHLLLEPLHMKGLHEFVVPPMLQLPAPSQVFSSVTDDAPAGHDGPWH